MKIINHTEHKYFEKLIEDAVVSHNFTNGGTPFKEIEITHYIINRLHLLIDGCEFVLEMAKNELSGNKRTINYTLYLLADGILKEFFSGVLVVNI